MKSWGEELKCLLSPCLLQGGIFSIFSGCVEAAEQRTLCILHYSSLAVTSSARLPSNRTIHLPASVIFKRWGPVYFRHNILQVSLPACNVFKPSPNMRLLRHRHKSLDWSMLLKQTIFSIPGLNERKLLMSLPAWWFVASHNPVREVKLSVGLQVSQTQCTVAWDFPVIYVKKR